MPPEIPRGQGDIEITPELAVAHDVLTEQVDRTLSEHFLDGRIEPDAYDEMLYQELEAELPYLGADGEIRKYLMDDDPTLSFDAVIAVEAWETFDEKEYYARSKKDGSWRHLHVANSDFGVARFQLRKLKSEGIHEDVLAEIEGERRANMDHMIHEVILNFRDLPLIATEDAELLTRALQEAEPASRPHHIEPRPDSGFEPS